MMQAQTGRVMWALLHAFALSYPEFTAPSDESRATFWLAVFGQCVKDASVSCPRCSEEWSKIIRDCPPDLESRTAFYHWTIAAHDRVNVARGKAVFHPLISLNHPLFKGYGS